MQAVRGYCWTGVQRFEIYSWDMCGVVERALCGGRNGGFVAYVQLLIQLVTVDQLLGTIQIKLPPVLHVKLYPSVTRKTADCLIRKTATLYHT